MENNYINYGNDALILAKLNGENWDIDSYIERGGYRALESILNHTFKIENIINEIKISGLRGRRCWLSNWIEVEFYAKGYSGQKYLVCNSDEGEPGTFKDRDILRYNPHIVIEGMIIAGLAMGITVGYNYIHGEIWDVYERFEIALDQASPKVFLGSNIKNSNLSFNLFAHHGWGAYICDRNCIA